jgi:predicted nucleotidyltransferase
VQVRRRIEPVERDRLRDAAARVLARWPNVVAAYFHGSAARGEAAADLDIAVAFDGDELGFAALDRLAAELEAEARVEGLEIDLRALGPATPRFRANVLRDGKLLFERDREARVRLEARFMIEWADFEPTWRRMRARMLERWADG